MTLLTICQDAAREIGIDVPSTIVGNTDPDAARLLRYAYKVGYRLMKSYDWQKQKQGISDTIDDLQSQDIYAYVNGLADGYTFDRFVPQSMWDRSNNRLITGPITLEEFRGLTELRDSGTGSPEKFTIRNDTLFFYPVPGGTETVIFEFVRGDWINSTDTSFGADADTVHFDEELVTLGVAYEFLMSRGLPYEHIKNQYDSLFETLAKNDLEGPSNQVLVSGDLWNSGRHYDGQPPVSNRSGLFSGL